MADPVIEPGTQDPGPQASPPIAKVPTEHLVLRGAPQRVVRFKRGVLIGGAAVGAAIIATLAYLALAPKTFRLSKAPTPAATPQHTTQADVVAALPSDYSHVTSSTPVLGPPLPGDLGKPILDHQRQLASDLGVPSNAALTPEQQAAAAERQKIATQAEQARQAGVLAQISSSDATRAASAAEAPSTPSGASAAASGASNSRLSLDTDHDQNGQQQKLDFVAQTLASASTDNPHGLQAPSSPYQVLAGSVISASLITGLNSDLPGLVIAQVSENVYDTATGHILLIPQGARLIGSYDSVVAFGQKRALLVWQRLILPDGASLQIDNLPATDAAGYTGLQDKVDFHTWQLLKGVGLSTLLGVGTELSFSDESDLIRALRESAQQSAGQAGQQIVTKALNIQPTLTVRPGWPLRIIVHKDLTLRPWTSTQ